MSVLRSCQSIWPRRVISFILSSGFLLISTPFGPITVSFWRAINTTTFSENGQISHKLIGLQHCDVTGNMWLLMLFPFPLSLRCRVMIMYQGKTRSCRDKTNNNETPTAHGTRQRSTTTPTTRGVPGVGREGIVQPTWGLPSLQTCSRRAPSLGKKFNSSSLEVEYDVQSNRSSVLMPDAG